MAYSYFFLHPGAHLAVTGISVTAIAAITERRLTSVVLGG
jgi:hypothetical protein